MSVLMTSKIFYFRLTISLAHHSHLYSRLTLVSLHFCTWQQKSGPT